MRAKTNNNTTIQNLKTFRRILSILLIFILAFSGCSSPVQEKIELELSQKELTIKVAEKAKLVLSDANGNEVHNAEWTSSDNSVATVRSTGTVTGISAGSATITVSYHDESFTCGVTVEKNEIELAAALAEESRKDTANVNAGDESGLIPVGNPDGGMNQQIAPDDGADTKADLKQVTDNTRKKIVLGYPNTDDSMESHAYYCALDEMKRLYPDIELEIKEYNPIDYQSNIDNIPADELPDIFFTNSGSDLGRLVENGKVYCIDDIYGKYRSTLGENMLSTSTFDGRHFMIPYTYSTVMMFVNMDVLKKAGIAEIPWNAETLCEAEKTLLSAGITPYGCALSEGWCVAEVLEPLMINRTGAEKMNRLFLGEVAWDDPEIYQAYSDFEEILCNGMFYEGSYNMDNDSIKKAFLDDEFAFYLNGTWNCYAFAYAENYKIIARNYPGHVDSGKNSYLVGGPESGFAISKCSDNPDLATEFAFEFAQRLSRYCYLDGCGLPAWMIDYDDSYVNVLLQDSAYYGFNADGFCIYGDEAMNAESAKKYVDSLVLMNSVTTPTEAVKDLADIIPVVEHDYSYSYDRKNTSSEVLSADNKTKLKLWCVMSYSSDEPLYNSLQELQELYPNLDIECETMETYAYKEKLKAAAFSGELPDIFYVWDCAFMKDFVDNGLLYSLNDTYNNYRKELPENMMESGTFANKRYSVPFSYEYVPMFVNMDVLKSVGVDSVPDNYSDFYTLEQKLIEAGITPYGCSFRELWCADEYFQTMLVNTCGHKAVNDMYYGNGSFGDENVYWTAVDFEAFPNSSLVFPDSIVMSNEEIIGKFLNDECAFYINGTWNCAQFDAAGNGKIQIASYPNKCDSEKGTLYMGGPTAGFAVSNSTANKDFAAEVAFEISRLLSKNNYLAENGLPCWRPDYDTSNVNGLLADAAEAGFESAGFSVWADTSMNSDDYNTYIYNFEKLVDGRLDASDFMSVLHKEIR